MSGCPGVKGSLRRHPFLSCRLSRDGKKEHREGVVTLIAVNGVMFLISAEDNQAP
jgi:hypothetical protein